MAKASMVLVALLALGCAGTRPPAWRTNVENFLRDNPLPGDQNIRVTEIGRTRDASIHVVEIRDAEPLHIHRRHDLSVLVYRGEGVMTMGTESFNVAAGDVFYVPKGLPHKFVNTASSPAVAVVTIFPVMQSRDFEEVPEK